MIQTSCNSPIMEVINMQKTYICPRCGKQMNLNTNSNVLRCKRFWLCSKEISLAQYLLSPDINICLGTTKTNGNIFFLINTQTKQFAIELDRTDNLNSNICNFGPFDIDKLISVQVIADDTTVYENKNSGIPMLAGGVLFGSIGAIAGSMISNQKHTVQKKSVYTLILKIESIHIPSIYIETSDGNVVYKFVNTIEQLRLTKE